MSNLGNLFFGTFSQLGPDGLPITWTKLLTGNSAFGLLLKGNAQFRAANTATSEYLIKVVITYSALLSQCAAGWYVDAHDCHSIVSID